MGQPCRVHHAVALAAFLFLSAPASAKGQREPLLSSLPRAQADAANAIAAACMGQGWTVRNRTDFSLECVDTRAEPQSSASFSLAEQTGETLVQVTTRQVVWPGPDPVFGPSWSLAEKVSAMLVSIGATPRQ